MCLGSGRSDEPSVRIQKHQIWQIGLLYGGIWVYLLCQTGFFALMPQMTTPGLFFSLLDSVQEFSPYACVCTECAPSFLVDRLQGCSVLGD